MENVQVLNRVGRDVTLTFVQSRQEVKQDHKLIKMPLHAISFTLDKGKATSIPIEVWEANLKTSLVRHYMTGDNPKLQVIEKNKSAAKKDASNDSLEDETDVADVVDAIRMMLSDDENKEDENLWTKQGLPELSALSDVVGSKVTSKMRDAALTAMDSE